MLLKSTNKTNTDSLFPSTLATEPAAFVDRRLNESRFTKLRILFGGHVWSIMVAFVLVVAIIIGAAIYFVHSRNAEVAQTAKAYVSQPLSEKVQASLNTTPLIAEDYLIGGSLNVAGILQTNRLTGSADMLVGSQDHTLALQGSNVSLAAGLGGSTNTLRFALPNGASKTITVPNASGTIAVSASGPLILDTNGNLSCPSCGASGAGVTNVTNTTITNVTNNNVTNAVGVSTMNAVSGDVLLQGTANQVVVTNSGDSHLITLSLPQDINMNASPVFANISITQSLQVADSITAGSLTLGAALEVTSGGTGATTANDARTNLGAAASGANIDITSLGGLTTALSVLQGGTGTTSYADGQLLIGNSAGGLTVATLTAGSGVMIVNGNGAITVSAPTAGTCPGCASTSLSNLSGVAINTSLLPATHNMIDVGSAATAFRSGYYGTSLYAPAFDTVGAGTLNIGASAATNITLGTHTSTATGKSLTVNGSGLFKNAVDSSSAFQVQNTAGVALLNANTTQGTLSVGTYVPTVVWSTAPTTTTNYTTGTAPRSVTTADFNGDGKPDLATANQAANTASVFLNNGNGTFATKVDYAAGTSPRSVTAADVNSDGKPDLMVANFSANTASVFLNNGNGTFATKVDYAAGTSPFSVTAADVNSDGKPDLMVANFSANTVSVFMNNGNGTFATKVDYATGTSPSPVTAADFNGDGNPDLAVANQGANTASVFMNNGNGTFATKVDYTTGTNPSFVTAADFNGDGKPDLAVANLSANTVSVFMNNGNGTFATKVDYAIGSSSYSGTSADFNGDSQVDLATISSNSSNMSVIIFGATTATTMTQAPSKLVVNASPTAIGQIIQGTAGQGADLLQVRDDINTTLFSVGATGNIIASGTLDVAGTFTATGSNTLFKNTANSTTAFQVQQASGATVFGVDTTNARIGIGTAAPANKLSVNALTTPDSLAQVAIGTAVTTNKGLVVQGVLNQTADLLQAQSSTGAILAKISATGVLTVASAVVTGNITLNGHIVTGGTAPTIAAGAASCTTPTVSITGNDTSGTVTIVSGTGCGVTGTLATVTLNTAFGSIPRIIMTPSNANATNLKWYNNNATTTTFTIDTATAPADATTYKFNYWAVQ